MERLLFGGAYVWREICVSKSIGLACRGKEIYHFCFVLLCIRGQIPSTSPPGVLYSEGRFSGGFFALRFWGGGGLIDGEAYFRNFTVYNLRIALLQTGLINGAQCFYHPLTLHATLSLKGCAKR